MVLLSPGIDLSEQTLNVEVFTGADTTDAIGIPA